MSIGQKREVDQMIKQLQRSKSGCTVKRTNAGHWKVTKPGCRQVIIASSPSDVHAIRNAKSELKRYLSIRL